MKIAVIGVGYWGPNYVRNLLVLEHTPVIYDLNQEKIAQAMDKFPQSTSVESLDEILSDDSIPAVVIATPLHTHYDLIREALVHNKHILVEKAMCYDDEQAQTVNTMMNGGVFMVGHITCYSPGIRRVKQELGAGSIGCPKAMEFRRTHMGPVYPGIDVFREVGSHDVSIALWLKGKTPCKVSANGISILNNGFYDYGIVNLMWDDGAIAHITAGWCCVERERRFAVMGDKGTLSYSLTPEGERVESTETIDYFNILQSINKTSQKSTKEKSKVIPIERSEPLQEQIKTFIDCIVSMKQPVSDAKFGCEVVKVVCAANRSAAAGGRTIKI